MRVDESYHGLFLAQNEKEILVKYLGDSDGKCHPRTSQLNGLNCAGKNDLLE